MASLDVRRWQDGGRHSLVAITLLLLAACRCAAQQTFPAAELLLDSPVALRGGEVEGQAVVAWPVGYLYANDTVAEYRVALGEAQGPPVLFNVLDPATGTLVQQVPFSLLAEEKGSVVLSVLFSVPDAAARSNGDSNLQAAVVGGGGWRETLPRGSARIVVVEGAVTLVPPILTLIAIVATRSVVVSLFVGIFFSALIICNFNPLTALLYVFNTELVNSLADAGHANVILFTWALSGMVACILKMGGGKGLVRSLSRYATSPRSGGVITIVLGSLIFFDGLASSLIIGPTMRPITDGLYMSRERLAFLVDGTSSPITSLSPVSTWVGFELSLIEQELQNLADAGEDISCYEASAMLVFLRTIPGRYYPILVVVLQLALVISGREFGPMLWYERKSRREGGNTSNDVKGEPGHADSGELFEPDPSIPHRWWSAFVPVFSVVITVVVTLVVTGIDSCKDQGLPLSGENIFGNSDSYSALLYASFVGSATAWILGRVQRTNDSGELVAPWRKGKPILTCSESLRVWIKGISEMTNTLIVLLLAWAVGSAYNTCGTGSFISGALKSSIPAEAFPTLSFLMSGLLAVLTGTSWGTMAIMFPIIVPAAHYAAPCGLNTFYGTVGGVLAGAVFGDHCSPISDTTVLTAQVCGCSLGTHVTTQGTYAIVCAVIATLVGTLPVGYGAYPDWAGLLLCSAVAVATVFTLGAPVSGHRQDLLSRGADGARAGVQRLLRRRVNTGSGPSRDDTSRLLDHGAGGHLYSESSA